ncbi:hypothetical protein HY745_01155 [Candidatus Desantisbacteria bacterium]|nr:hypothetical protein [Candidatus Desantisbacteria bacterium]
MLKNKINFVILIVLALILGIISIIFSEPEDKTVKVEKPVKKEIKNESKALEQFAKKKGKGDLKNPHDEIDCTECHAKKPVRGKDTPATVTFINEDFNLLCTNCHSQESNIHPVGIVPPFKVPDNLPLDKQGRNTCVTCHDVHLKDIGNSLLRGFEEGGKYTARTDLCYDCHGDSYANNNPHLTQIGKRKCLFCHSSEPSLTDNEKTIHMKVNIFSLCDFCHNVIKKNHPLNVDETISPPEELPRDSDGNVTCATCHNPHGTTETVHYLRREYVLSLEEEKFINPHFSKTHCKACHLTEPKADDARDKVDFKYKGNFIALCNSCHGASANIHPVDIVPPVDMKVPADLPLNKEGKITCITCHDAGFVNRSVKYLIRGGENFAEVNELCYRCHEKEKFKKMNPHSKIKEERKCMFCHIVPPNEDDDSPETVKIKTSIRLLCIRCHSDRPHPSNFKHLIRPAMVIPKTYPLDDGFITCTTCHDPHMGELKFKKKKKRGDDEEEEQDTKQEQAKEQVLRLEFGKKTKSLRKGFSCKICHINL